MLFTPGEKVAFEETGPLVELVALVLVEFDAAAVEFDAAVGRTSGVALDDICWMLFLVPAVATLATLSTPVTFTL